MSVALNDAAIERFFNERGGKVEELLVESAERLKEAEIIEANELTMNTNRYDSSRVIDYEILEGPLRASVGLVERGFLGPQGFFRRKAAEEQGWLTKALARARSA